MASRDGVDDVLKLTPERVKFYRLTTLLIAGGTEILRQVFDRIHPPNTLATVLATVKSTIKRTAKLANVQMDLLYPPTGDPVSSRRFDITLLFSLLRHRICNLAPPAKGWDEMPDGTDHSLVADLARIKYYRNKVYGHVDGRMELTSDQFNVLWQAISEALLRIVGTADEDERTRWMNNILKWRCAPLKPDASLILLIQRLKEWHEAEKEEMKRITQSIKVLNLSVQGNTKTIIEENSKTQKSLEKVQDTLSQLATETSAAPASLHISSSHHQGNINIIHYSGHDTNPDTPKPALRSPGYSPEELTGTPCTGEWGTQAIRHPLKRNSNSSVGSPTSGFSAGFDSQSERSPVTPLSPASSDLTRQSMPASTGNVTTGWHFPYNPIPQVRGSSLGDARRRSADSASMDASVASSNAPRNETIANTVLGSVSPVSPRYDSSRHGMPSPPCSPISQGRSSSPNDVRPRWNAVATPKDTRFRPQSTPSTCSPPNIAVRSQYSTSASFGRNRPMDSDPFSAKSEGHDAGKLMQLILVSYFV